MAHSRICESCGNTFEVQYKSMKKRFCNYSCSNRVTAKSRTGDKNSRWSGGKSEHYLYHTYNDMLGRCSRKTHNSYNRYGGRGIYVCGRWKEDFWNFVEDMGPRPEGFSIDRINNDGPYSPENCKWSSSSDQNKNKQSYGYENRVRNEKGQWQSQLVS